jgi:hypothetical protein
VGRGFRSPSVSKGHDVKVAVSARLQPRESVGSGEVLSLLSSESVTNPKPTFDLVPDSQTARFHGPRDSDAQAILANHGWGFRTALS